MGTLRNISSAGIMMLLCSSGLIAQDGGTACSHELSGSVINADRDTLVINLTVDLFDGQGRSRPITIDSAGNFRATIACDQFYQLVVRANGFETRRELITSCATDCHDFHHYIEFSNAPIGICGNRP